MTPSTSGYADIHGLHMYYEVHGEGTPLLLLHGEFATAEMFHALLSELTKTHKVIIAEQQGHGRTADIDRPFSFRSMADDTAALLQHLGIENADVFGYSGGSTVALNLAIHYPKLVQQLALASAFYNEEGYDPDIFEFIKQADPEAFPPDLREAYERVAPRPQDWATLVHKSAKMAQDGAGFLKPDQLDSIQVPALVMMGDEDFIRPEHGEDIAKRLHTELVLLPGDHSSYVTDDPDALLARLQAFLA